jgi:EAL domain-containing protein (putative c-di-GMP-specific phosphodiesterase class I)
VTVAAGCAVADDPEAEAPVAAARHALLEAMSSGIGCIRFAEETDAAARRRGDVANAARVAIGAIRDGNLVNAYQPVVSAAGHPRAAFHECLVRVREASGELIAAGAFMPAMEQLGLATLIDRRVLVLALDALADDPGIRLSINIFPQTMQDAQWMMLFDQGTSRDPALAERLIIEVTETAAMLEPARTLAFMNRLRRKGCSFALDDFGMGHTSFGSLRDFRFDIIKIDGSFITDVATNPDSRFFVEKLVEVGEHFDMMTVAEFVQSAADARILRDLGVEYFQGFFFGSPSLTLAPDLKPEPTIAGPLVVGAR